MSEFSHIPLVISTPHDLVEAAACAYTHFKRIPQYRGVPNAKWPLLPSLFRPRNDGWTPSDVRWYERSLVNDFVRYAPSRAATVPPLADKAAWLCLMRHYGLPTRLLDWTASIFIAAYFATGESDSSSAAIWALDTAAINLAATGKEQNLSMRGDDAVVKSLLAMPFEERPTSEATVFVIAPQVDQRMLCQQASFTLHGTSTPLEAMPGAERFLLKFPIAAGCNASLKHGLTLLGIDKMNLFPDLGNLCSALASRRYG